MTVRVAFTLFGGRGWMGGYNYLLNLFNALETHGKGRIDIVLFAGEDAPRELIEPLAVRSRVRIIRDGVFDASRASRSLAWSLLLGRDPKVGSLLEAAGIDLVFEAAQFRGWRVGRPAIAWMPDFQHRVMPDFFPLSARLKREIGFRVQIMTGRHVMVSSDDSGETCGALYPSARGRIRTVRFAVPPPREFTPVQADALRVRYGLPDNFFFMPNQYWRHKDHVTVIEALALLASRGCRPVVFASGSQSDPRDPQHIHRLRDLVERSGVSRQFLMPGLIPADDLAGLMCACQALINPSLFEGWSTTVEEARSAGTPMILSDLPVHLEQAADEAVFFHRQDPQDLARVLEAHVPVAADERSRLRQAARLNADRRMSAFADGFASLVEACVR
jgi:glycosyltransferase involved in cell wall biosynthesis